MAVPARLARAIHACRRRVAGLEDEAAWRAFLAQAVGTDSLRRMSGPELGRVLDALHQRGAPRAPAKGAGRAAIPRDPQASKIRALWIELGRAGAIEDSSERALDAWVLRQCGVASLRWADGGQKVRLVEALKAWARRVGAGAA